LLWASCALIQDCASFRGATNLATENRKELNASAMDGKVQTNTMNILVLGISGMLGHVVYKTFAAETRFKVWGTVRSLSRLRALPRTDTSCVLANVDALDSEALTAVLEQTRPHVVVNCIGLVKQLPSADDPLVALPINAILPHRLASFCSLIGARLVHVSTDCVFSGSRGRYTEADPSDATDLYGRSKYLGELQGLPHAVTLRTSIIGHNPESAHALIDWFLSQTGSVRGYSQAIFSGLPTVELARVIRDYVIPHPELSGVYHVSAEPIDKLSLLRLVAQVYLKGIEIVPDDSVRIDRSLDSSRFRNATGYSPPDWPSLVRLMHNLRN
jgi:dTDP-4-dehydrorhamnose reductase